MPSSVAVLESYVSQLAPSARRGYLFALTAEGLVRILRQKPHGETVTGPVWMIADVDIQRAAKELVERHGDNALVIAGEHVAALSAADDQAAMNAALRVVSVLEKLLAGEPKPAGQAPRE